MTLPKAIELNIESERSLRKHKFIDHADAIKLGNVALKREQYHRSCYPNQSPNLLPGETEE